MTRTSCPFNPFPGPWSTDIHILGDPGPGWDRLWTAGGQADRPRQDDPARFRAVQDDLGGGGVTTSSGAVVAELVQQAIRHAFEEIRSAGVRVEDLTQEVDRARRLLESAMTRVHWRSAAGEGCRREAEEIQRDLSRVVDECAQAVEFLRSFEARHGR